MHNLTSLIQKKKLILWDFDGCFCDSERQHFLAYREAFRDFSHEVDETNYYEIFTHQGLGVDVEISVNKLLCSKEEICLRKEKIYSKMIHTPPGLDLFFEVPQLVSLWQSWGLKNVIASNSKNADIEVILNMWNERHRLDAPCYVDQVCGLQPNMRKKPFPDIFLWAMAQHGIAPVDTLVIEDSQRGLYAAQAAGCEALWVETPFNQDKSTNAPFLTKITHKRLLDLCKV